MFFHFAQVRSFALFLLTTYAISTLKLAMSENSIINHICDKTSFPSFCKNVIYSNSRSQNANISIIADISINLAARSASTAFSFVKRGANHLHKPTKYYLKTCESRCHKVMKYMDRAKILWRFGDVEKTKIIAVKSILVLHEGCNYKLQNAMLGPLNEKVVILMRSLDIVKAVCDYAICDIN